jgi:hypothetical protein
MKKQSLIVIIIAFMVSSAIVNAATFQIITDRYFDSGYSYWDTTGSVTIDTSVKYAGGQSMKMEGEATLAQLIDLPSYPQDDLKFYGLSSVSSDSIYVTLSYTDSTIVTTEVSLTDSWAEKSVTTDHTKRIQEVIFSTYKNEPYTLYGDTKWVDVPSLEVLAEPSVDIEKSTNGEDADTAPGSYIAIGDVITWEYIITNTGNVELSYVDVTDSSLGFLSTISTIDPGEMAIVNAGGYAVAGQYSNIGTVDAMYLDEHYVDSDPSHYYGVESLIMGYKYEDLNGNAIWEAGEPPLAGWTFYLEDADHNVLASTVTGADGSFIFMNMPFGEYYVREELAPGWYQTYPEGSDYWWVELTEQAPIKGTIQFGNAQPVEIWGKKWNDLDGDGIWDKCEPPLEGWSIELLDAAGNVLATDVTDADGVYGFFATPGTYIVREVLAYGWDQTYPSSLGTHTVMLLSGEVSMCNNFGNRWIVGTIIVEKEIEWGVNSQYYNHPVFEFLLGPQITFWLADGEVAIFDLEIGTYKIEETTPGWSTKIIVKGGGYDLELDGKIVEVNLEAHDTIVITFINRPPDFVIPEAPLGTLLILAMMVVAYLVNNRKLVVIPT